MQRHDEAQSAFVRGDAVPLKRIWSEGDDVSLFGAMGSYAHGWSDVGARLDWAASQFAPADGEAFWEREGISVSVSPGLASSVHLERFRARVGKNGRERLVEVRVTLVWRHENDGWRIVHRHGDALRPTHVPE